MKRLGLLAITLSTWLFIVAFLMGRFDLALVAVLSAVATLLIVGSAKT